MSEEKSQEEKVRQNQVEMARSMNCLLYTSMGQRMPG